MIVRRQHSCRLCRAGFTLLELIVVVVLTAILMTAVAGVLTSILRTSKQSTEAISPVAAQQLRRDLTNATRYRFSPNRLELRGMLAQEPTTHRPLWMEADVSYSIESTQSGGLLKRRQTVANAIVSVEPIWLGVGMIEYATSYLDGADEFGNDQRPFLSDGWRLLPPSFKVQIRDENDRVRLSEVIAGVGL